MIEIEEIQVAFIILFYSVHPKTILEISKQNQNNISLVLWQNSIL